MLISLTDIIKKYNLSIKGIIHVGAHHGEEYEEYIACGITNIIFIEPCSRAFKILKSKFPKVSLYNCALGSEQGTALMNVETENKGQSNSILKPAKHLKQYPSITFNETELVQVRRMDQLNSNGCNMVNMDVQGYELEVLKGATKTLERIDYIYTEVNRDELYEGCARVEQLDQFLKDFDRVHTNWGGGTWGDALYIRKKKPEVPAEFRPHIKHSYPGDNKLIFEEWFAEQKIPTTERVYLPIFWTSYYVNNKYGKDLNAIKKLQDYIDTIDKTKKYYTVCQYDDGILNDLSGLDIKVFAMSKGYDYPLPLISKPHIFQFNSRRDIFANFIGRPTHPIRKNLFHLDKIRLLSGEERYFITDKIYTLIQYCEILSRSVFTLCPRGYGPTSFRIQEALQYGSIPVYISDEFVIPHNLMFENYGVIVTEKGLPNIDKLLRSIPPEEIKRKQQALPGMFKNYFSYEGNLKIILENI